MNVHGHMHSLNVTDEQSIITSLQRIIDLEEADKETMHLLIFLLMQFLSRSDQAYPSDEKYLAKVQNIVLRHIYLLLGYSQNDRGLYLPPQRLRSSPAFSVFLSNLPQLLDQNNLIGRLILPTALIILQYSPSPYYISNTMDLIHPPNYSLWALESHFRRNWLMALVVLLYKYQYNFQPHCIQLTSLIRIVLNTLDSQQHHCRRIPATILMGAQTSRSRDLSQPSLGTDNEHIEKGTPPLSPMFSSNGQSIQVSISSKTGKSQVTYTKAVNMETHWEESPIWDKNNIKKSHNLSFDCDDTESELNAIPESDVSDNNSTFHSSIQDFNDGGGVIDDNNKTIYNLLKTQESIDTAIIKSPKKGYLIRTLSNRKPSWYLSNEDENKKDNNNRSAGDLKKSKLTSHIALINGSQLARTVTTDYHKQLKSSTIDNIQQQQQQQQHHHHHHHNYNIASTPLGKQKKIIEPSITPVCTPTSDSDDNNGYKNHQMLPAPSIERLLPIGKIKSSSTTNELSSQLDTQLEIPSQERLLPIGQHAKDMSQLVDKVRQALGINHQYKSLENNKYDKSFQYRGEHSPRRLIKQVALESPPSNINNGNGANGGSYDNGFNIDDFLNKSTMMTTTTTTTSTTTITTTNNNNNNNNSTSKEIVLNSRQQRIRKIGPFTMSSHQTHDPRRPGTWLSSQFSPKYDKNYLKQSQFRIGDDCMNERCTECGTIKEEYSDEEIGLCIVTLGTFIHREPTLAASLLPDILTIVSRVASNAAYPWQCESNIHLPGGAISVAHQFLRCVLHQLAPNGIFTQIFQTNAAESVRVKFFKSVIQALIDFNELNPIAPIQLLLESLNTKKTLPIDILPIILQNIACYLNCLPLEAALGPTTPLWSNVLQLIESLFRRLLLLLNTFDDISPLLQIMISLFKIPLISQFKGILEPFSKVLSHAIQTHILKYNYLVEICYLCNRAFTKERDKLILSRMVVFELVQTLKFKLTIPDSNLLMLINLLLQDIGGSIPPNVMIKDCPDLFMEFCATVNTGISECMRIHMGDVLEFLTDFHTSQKMKSYCKGVSVGLNDDTLGGIIKCNMAQYLALEITKGNGRDNRAVQRYFPWLYNTSIMQQTPKEFLECIGHIRLLSWLLLGSLTYTAMHCKSNCNISCNNNNNNQSFSQPIPQEASCQISDHIQTVMQGFAEQPKATVLHMSSLFHTFILCQLWTIYLEQSLNNHMPVSEAYNTTMNILFEFWSKVTPCILQLIQQSKMLKEIVSLHFINMLEALLECRSTLVGKLLPLWMPVLCSNQIHLPVYLQVRLQNCRNFSPTLLSSDTLTEKSKNDINNPILLKWLQRLQFKMGQIELQSAAATQFYSL